jgi:hypothetical protein
LTKFGRAALIILALFLLPTITTPALARSSSAITWARTYTGTEGFVGSSVEQTSDGGFIVAGSTVSSQFLGQTWLLRLDATGGIVWQKAYGSFSSATPVVPEGPKVKQTLDGGFVVSSSTNVSKNTEAAWIFKVDQTGNLIWQEAFTGIGNATAFSIDTTFDGGFLVAGATSTTRGLLVAGSALVLKLDSTGGLMWERTFAGEGNAFAYSVYHTSDGGAIVSGGTSLLGCCELADAWLLKLDAAGNLLWQNKYQDNYSILFSVQETSDGGFVSAGIGNLEIAVLRVDRTGTPIWQKNYGVSGRGVVHSVRQTSDGGFILAGSSGTTAMPFNPNPLVFRLDVSGNIVWQKEFITGFYSEAFSAIQTSDGGFVTVGYAPVPTAPPTSPGIGALVFKLDAKGVIQHCTPLTDSNLVTSSTTSVGVPITTSGVDTGALPRPTTAVSVMTSADAVVMCHHGFKV